MMLKNIYPVVKQVHFAKDTALVTERRSTALKEHQYKSRFVYDVVSAFAPLQFSIPLCILLLLKLHNCDVLHFATLIHIITSCLCIRKVKHLIQRWRHMIASYNPFRCTLGIIFLIYLIYKNNFWSAWLLFNDVILQKVICNIINVNTT